jgi:hypothetical protein
VLLVATRRRVPATVAGLVVLAVALGAAGQRRGLFGTFEPPVHNAHYDGRFTFARIRYTTGPGGYQYCGLPSWAHGYLSCQGGSRAETSLVKIMNEISLLNPRIEESVVLSLDDPELTKYPIAYMVEAGYWTLTDQEATAFRAYLLKGGLAIFDDFRDAPGDRGAWDNFETNMRRVIPGARFVDLSMSHPVFDSFFRVQTLDIIPQSYDLGRPIIRGLFEGNDTTKRLLAIVNYNTDVSDFWEFSATGFRPIEESNEAYKLGVNYIMYGLLH